MTPETDRAAYWNTPSVTADFACKECIHYLKGNTCKAFPKGMPYQIFNNQIVHTMLVEGQESDFVLTKKD